MLFAGDDLPTMYEWARVCIRLGYTASRELAKGQGDTYLKMPVFAEFLETYWGLNGCPTGVDSDAMRFNNRYLGWHIFLARDVKQITPQYRLWRSEGFYDRMHGDRNEMFPFYELNEQNRIDIALLDMSPGPGQYARYLPDIGVKFVNNHGIIRYEIPIYEKELICGRPTDHGPSQNTPDT